MTSAIEMQCVTFGKCAFTHLGYFEDEPDGIYFIAEHAAKKYEITRFEGEHVAELATLFDRARLGIHIWSKDPDCTSVITVSGSYSKLEIGLNRIVITCQDSGKPPVVIPNSYPAGKDMDVKAVEYFTDVIERITNVLSAHANGVKKKELEEVYRQNAGHDSGRVINFLVDSPRTKYRLTNIFVIGSDLPGIHGDDIMLLQYGGSQSRVTVPLRKAEGAIEHLLKSFRGTKSEGKHHSSLHLFAGDGSPRLVHIFQGVRANATKGEPPVFLFGLTTAGLWSAQHAHLRVSEEMVDKIIEKLEVIETHVNTMK